MFCQVYYGVKWQPKFKSPTRHCFAIKHPQIQAKNPKYIRYLCADTEAELNKWVVGARLAKYGRTLYENYRGIVEEMAHEDIDRLASARLSVNSGNNNEAAATAAAQQQQHQHLVNGHSAINNNNVVMSEDSISKASSSVSARRSASGGGGASSSASSSLHFPSAASPVPSASSSSLGGVTTTVIVHSSQVRSFSMYFL